jgi:hypothetical protein
MDWFITLQFLNTSLFSGEQISKSFDLITFHKLKKCITTTEWPLVGLAVMLYSCIWELSSNLNHDTIVTEMFQFSPVPPSKCQNGTSIRPWPLPSKSFAIHHSYIILSSDNTQSVINEDSLWYWKHFKINHKKINKWPLIPF